MSASLNRVILIGNLTGDPELRYTPGGTARARFSIAVNRQYKDASGQLQEEVTFVPIVTWGSQAENCANYLRKGRSVAVEGRLRIDSFENAEGERVKITEVVASTVQFLGGPTRSSDEPGTVSAPATTDESQPPEEEVPF
ncbi:MAG: single-stranded DNA-binding protein [Candidatus Bipolaricaulia bacterium]